MKAYLAAACLACLVFTNSQAAVLYFLDEHGSMVGVENPQAQDPISAVTALNTPPDSFEGGLLTSTVPAGTEVLNLYSDGETVTVEFSEAVLSKGMDDEALQRMFDQVRATLRQFEIGESVRLQTGGRLLSEYLPPTPVIEPAREPKQALAPGTETQAAVALSGALAGKSISLSPGHGKRWSGTSFSFERPVYCAPLNCEDDHNLEIMTYLDLYLRQDGAVTKVYRCLNKNYGTYAPANEPWWRMSASYWLKQNGYPCSVYSSLSGECTLGNGESDSNDSLRSRGLASDYDNTDIYVSLHSNGSAGDCSGTGCPNGTCTYYDTSTEHATWGASSRTLAQRVNSSIVDVIRTKWNDTTWRDRGSIDANGSQAETRIPNRAAVLIELAFHDTCDRDAVALRDEFFRSATMWGAYKGICDYFGVAPTWDFYSCEIVSDTIPPQMPPGSSAIVQVTLRNRGVLWNDARQFRLGAVGNSDPFTATTRYNVGTQIPPGGTKTFAFTLKAPLTPGVYTTDWQMLREGIAWFGPVLSKKILVSTEQDDQPPSIPSGLVATPVSPTQVNLRWNPASDNLGIGSYKIYRNAAFLGSSASTNYSDTSSASMTTYRYQVLAVDYSGNESAQSAAVTVTTPAQLEFILDNKDGVATGAWQTGTSSGDKYGADYHFLSTATTPSGTFRWTPRIEQAGFYTVEVWYPQGANRCTNAPYTIQFAGGSVVAPVNQVISGGGWVSLGVPRPFVSGTSGYVQLSNATQEPAKVVMADAVRFSYASALPPIPPVQVSFQGKIPALSWSNPYSVLQECSSLETGLWVDVPGAKSPFTVNTASGGQKYYRLRY